jgi:hypothetical protein
MLLGGQIGACELELELVHSQDQKDLKLSQVGVGVAVGVGDMHVADIQVVDMWVEETLLEDILAFPGTLQQDIACHIPFQIGELFANQASLELMLDIVQQRYPLEVLSCHWIYCQ